MRMAFKKFREKLKDSRKEFLENKVEFNKTLVEESSQYLKTSTFLGIFAWLGYALDTDTKLHPEFEELFYFRILLTIMLIHPLSLNESKAKK